MEGPERRTVAQRGAKRHREIVERATIVYEGKKSLAKVVNISASGLTLESAIPAQIGERIQI